MQAEVPFKSNAFTNIADFEALCGLKPGERPLHSIAARYEFITKSTGHGFVPKIYRVVHFSIFHSIEALNRFELIVTKLCKNPFWQTVPLPGDPATGTPPHAFYRLEST